MSLGLPSSVKLLDKVTGVASAAWQGWFQKIDNALILFGTLTPGNIIVSDGGNNVVDGGAPSTGTVTNTGTLTDHAVIVGNGGVDVSALSSLGSSGQVLTSQGAGLDPQWAAASSSSDAETLAWLGL